ncbi:MAG TPA: hypothetical protein VGO46_09320 [Gemmatimonadaceae bacterium]|nr:hypothetical protein [Gemmatimonadaceae bacterium]
MMMIANATRAREIAQRLVLVVALGTTAWGCPHGGTNNPNELLYVHGRIHVDKETAARWDAGEAAIAAVGEKITPIPADDKNPSAVPFSGDARTILGALEPSERHGATDKRLLSVLGEDRGKQKFFQSSGVVAQITLVKGSEYKSEAHFRKGWLPMAIVVLPDTFPAGTVAYPKLKLHGGTSWIFVHEQSQSKWVASIVRLVDGKVEQDPLDITIASNDNVEPVIGARFVWEDNDESVWGYCAGNCCKIGAPK